MPGSTFVQAGPPSTVVLVRTPSDEPGRWRTAEERIRDELRVMGMGVVEVELREDRAQIERALVEHGARVAVHVERDGEGGGAEIWWVDPEGGELRAVRIDGLATEGRAAATVAALRAAELVRTQAQPRSEGGEEAGLGDRSRPGPPARGADTRSAAAVATEMSGVGELGAHVDADARDRAPPISVGWADIAVPEAPGEIDVLDFVVAAPAPVEPPPRPPDTGGPGNRGVGLYAGIGGGPGGAGPLMGGALALRWDLSRGLAIQGEAQGSTSPGWLSGQGQTFRVGLAGARAALVFIARRDARVSWRLGLGGGVTLAWALARSRDQLHRSQDRVVVGALRASVHAAIRVRAQLRLVVGLDVDLLGPPVAVRVLDAEVARLGTPLVRGVLGFEWDWWSRAHR